MEFALALPLLLLILLGIADLGRAFFYTSLITNAARVGAQYASLNAATVTSSAVAAKVCNETGLVPYAPNATCPGLSTAATFGRGQDSVVTVSYELPLVSSYLADRVLRIDPFVLRASATFPGLQQ